MGQYQKRFVPRLAQYYHEIAQETEVRIDMASGSYVPEFRFLVPPAVQPEHPQSAVPVPVELPAPTVSVAPRLSHRWILLLVSGLAVLALAIFVFSRLRHTDPLQAFWSPIWANTDVVIIAAGTNLDEAWRPGQPAAPNAEPNSIETFRMDQIGFADAISMARVSGLVQSNGKQIEIKRAASLSLGDLRKAPAIMVGAINNPWTIRLSAALRFAVERELDSSLARIVDHQKTSLTMENGPAGTVFASYARLGRDLPFPRSPH